MKQGVSKHLQCLFKIFLFTIHLTPFSCSHNTDTSHHITTSHHTTTSTDTTLLHPSINIGSNVTMSTVMFRDASTAEKNAQKLLHEQNIHLSQSYETPEQRKRRMQKYSLWAGIFLSFVNLVVMIYLLNFMFKTRSVYKPGFSPPFPIASPPSNIDTWPTVSEVSKLMVLVLS